MTCIDIKLLGARGSRCLLGVLLSFMSAAADDASLHYYDVFVKMFAKNADIILWVFVEFLKVRFRFGIS